MQTQTQSTQKPQSDLDKSIATAETQHQKLTQAANDAEAEAKRWGVTFEREPTAQAATEKLVAEQKAKNAQAAADAFHRDTLAPLLEQRREREQDAERLALAEELDIAKVHALQDQIEQAIIACVETVQSVGQELADLEEMRWQKSGRAGQLGLQVPCHKFDQLVNAIDARLPKTDGHSPDHTAFTVHQAGAGRAVLTVQIAQSVRLHGRIL